MHVEENGQYIATAKDVEIEVHMGAGDSVVLDKLFGPRIFASLRITADLEKGWIIEREWIGSGERVEWCVIPAQLEIEFRDKSEGD